MAKANWAEDWKEQFIVRIGQDGRTLRSVVKDKDMPGHTYLFEELERDRTFAERYTRASEQRADGIFDDILDIADDSVADPQDRRVRIDARKWVLSKMRPKKYGDKVQLEHESPDGSMSPSGDIPATQRLMELLESMAPQVEDEKPS